MYHTAINGKRDKLHSIIFFSISILFYLFFAVYDGVVICADSPSYIYMHVSREPFYCTFLAVLRTCFGLFGDTSEFYLVVVVYIQSLLAAFAAWCLADYLKREFSLSFFQGCIVLCIPLMTSLLCRFAAKRASMYSNSILTEGIACSLFLIYIRYLLELYCKKTRRSLIISAALSFIMIATRKQMYITLLLLVIVICWIYIAEKRFRKGILTALLCAFCIFAANMIFDNSYNYIVRGEMGTHSSDNRFMATMVIYTSERSYGEEITDAETRNLFYQIYDICDSQGYLKHSAGQGWYNRVNFFGEHYDNVQIDTMWPAIQNYVYANYEGGEVFLEQKVDEITNRIIVELLPKVWPGVFGCFIDNFFSGLVTTVAQMRPILVIYSIAVFIFYFILLIIQIKLEGVTNLSFFAVCTMLSIVINVAVVSMVIFCQTRYTIYNMPLFYITLWILFVKDIRLLLERRSAKI